MGLGFAGLDRLVGSTSYLSDDCRNVLREAVGRLNTFSPT